VTADLTFSGNPLDRASHRRGDEAWLAEQASAGLFLPFWQNRPFVVDEHAGFLPWRESWRTCTHVFLGLDGEQALFAVDLPGEEEPQLGYGGFAEMRASAILCLQTGHIGRSFGEPIRFTSASYDFSLCKFDRQFSSSWHVPVRVNWPAYSRPSHLDFDCVPSAANCFR